VRTRIKLNIGLFSIYAMLEDFIFSKLIGPSHLYGPIFTKEPSFSLMKSIFKPSKNMICIKVKN
jgi:hypothetical protein